MMMNDDDLPMYYESYRYLFYLERSARDTWKLNIIHEISKLGYKFKMVNIIA